MTLIELYIPWGEKGKYYHLFYAYCVSAFPLKIYLFSAPPQKKLSVYIFQFQFCK